MGVKKTKKKNKKKTNKQTNKKKERNPLLGKKVSFFFVFRFYFLVFLLEVTPPCRGEKAYRAFELWTKSFH